MIAIEVHETIADVDRADWDRIVGDDVFSGWGWLQTVEESARVPRSYRYFVARTSDGIAGVAPCYLEDPDTGLADVDGVVFGRFARLARRLRLSVAPALVCGARVGLGGHILVRRDASEAEKRRVTVHLLDAMEAAASTRGWTLCFRNVARSQTLLVEALGTRRYARAAELPTTVLDIRWTSFDDYVRDLKTVHPATAENIKRDIKRARKSGLVLEKLADPRPLQEQLHGLLDAHYQRRNHKPFPFAPVLVTTLWRNLGNKVVVYVASKDSELLSVAIGVRAGDSLFLPVTGNNDSHRETRSYFNNFFYEPIADAIGSGIRRIYFGKLVYDLKTRRGCEIMELSLYLRFDGRVNAAVHKALLACQPFSVRRTVARA